MNNETIVNLYTGRITKILNDDNAVIKFKINNTTYKAFLTKNVYFYNARSIPSDNPLKNYIAVNMEVYFTGCKATNEEYQYIAMMCWNKKHSLGESIKIEAKMTYVAGRIDCLEGKRGVLVVNDYGDKEEFEVYFTLNRFFFNDEQIYYSPDLLDFLTVARMVYFDAIPCISKENTFRCKWRTTCVFLGSRNYQKPLMELTDLTSEKIMKYIENCVNCHLLYIAGRGRFVGSFSEDIGVLLGEFLNGTTQEVMFHKNNIYMSKLCLIYEKTSTIYKKGDLFNFIAVTAPSNCTIRWVAFEVNKVTK